MPIPEELKKLLESEDYRLIKDLYDERHTMGDNADKKTVSVTYVRLVCTGERTTQRKNTQADEIILIAKKYLKHKRDFRLNIQAI